jgi:hypothetical protein
MTTTVSAYLDEMEQAFLLSPVVRPLQVREREERLQEGLIANPRRPRGRPVEARLSPLLGARGAHTTALPLVR